MIKPMAAHPGPSTLDKLEELFNQEQLWIVQEKIDGIRLIVTIEKYSHKPKHGITIEGDKDIVTAQTRSGKVFDIQNYAPHIVGEIQRLFRAEGGTTVLDCELFVPGYQKGFERLTAITKSKAQRAWDMQKANPWSEALHLGVFDVLTVDGCGVQKLPLQHRLEMLSNVLRPKESENYDTKVDGFVFQLPWFLSNEKACMPWVKGLMNFGAEGLILKKVDSTYQVGKRSKDWLKFKPKFTADVIICGFIPGRGKYRDTLGALQFMARFSDGSAYIGACSGMSDEQRHMFWNDQDEYLGKVIEISHWGRHSRVSNEPGSFRHPQFIRLRDDKTVEDAIEPIES